MARELVIASRTVSDDADCFVIAEIGHNHQGKLETALEMMRVAKENGASAVKFQKRDNRALFTRALYDAPYDNENSYGRTYGEHREFLEFGRAEFEEVQAYAKELDIIAFATAFDLPSADFLAALDMPLYKFASADLTNLPLLKHVAGFGKPMILSTGGGTLDDVRRAVETICAVNDQLCVLQCTAAYPVQDYEDMNLRVIETYRREFPELVVGLSDHESGIAMALVAYMLGARVIEKHFTLNRAWRGTDHSFSLAPVGLRKLVRDLGRARIALGDGVKRPLACEERPLRKMSKKLVFAHDLPAGHVLTEGDLIGKSTGSEGISPADLDQVLGRALRAEVGEDETLTRDHLA